MIRPFRVLVWLGPLVISIALGAPPAHAHVDDSCSFELSPPQSATLPGGAMGIVATLKPTACHGRAQPTKSTVCISAPADPAMCSTKWAWMTARAFLGSTQPKVKVTVTGVGCSTASDTGQAEDAGDQKSTCQSFGPLEATL